MRSVVSNVTQFKVFNLFLFKIQSQKTQAKSGVARGILKTLEKNKKIQWFKQKVKFRINLGFIKFNCQFGKTVWPVIANIYVYMHI